MLFLDSYLEENDKINLNYTFKKYLREFLLVFE